MSRISTHVLDVVLGTPAAGVPVRLDRKAGDAWIAILSAVTDADGRCANLAPQAQSGVYRLSFDSGAYLKRYGRAGIYPEISVIFACDGETNYHLPLLLSDNGYTTYRGS
jgi:5-hydroxyisourate hydrolase